VNRRHKIPPVFYFAALFVSVFGVVYYFAPSRTVRVSAAPGVSGVDVRGKRITLPALPQRIVSLSPGTTEMLFALGLKGRIVADTTFCNYPSEAVKLPKIGDVNTSTEKVIAQRPDLVVAGATANRRAIEPLERLHLPVFAVDPKTFSETYTALRSLGQITGQAKEAEAVVKSIQAKVAGVTRAVSREKARPRVLTIVQLEPLMVVGPNNFMDDIITLAGGDNVGRVTGKDWGTLSPERVVPLKPDVIIAGRSDRDRILSRAGWANVPAIKNRAIYNLPGDEANRPGPRLTVALEQLARTLHPHAFSAVK
jgi:iron complex transport system substrate-binding protein